MNRLLRILHFLRIVDDNGVLSISHWFTAVAIILFWRYHDAVTAGVVTGAVANYSIAKKGIPFWSQAMAAKHADAALARQHDLAKTEAQADVKKTQELVTKLAEKVRDLATPERLEAMRNAAGPVAPSPRLPVVPRRL